MFEREINLIGEDNYLKLKNSNILVIGVGGVGGYAVETLIRSGIENITLVDYDNIDISNINRQVIALSSNIGNSKVEEFKKRILSINSNVKVKISDIRDTNYDPLAKALRKYVKDEKFRDKVICISSTEEPIKTNKTMVTSMMMVPSTAGIYAASYVINSIIKENK